MGDPAASGGREGTFTRHEGFLAYYEVRIQDVCVCLGYPPGFSVLVYFSSIGHVIRTGNMRLIRSLMPSPNSL